MSFPAGWTRTSAPTNFFWRSLACESTGTILFACAGQSGQTINPLYRSTNSGSSWTSFTVNAAFSKIACSSDGLKVVAIGGSDIHKSTNAGVTWTPTGNSSLNTQNWYSIASSSDGSKLVAVVFQGDIYRSSDSGITWTPTGNSNLNTIQWYSVAISSNGSTVVAVPLSGDIYRSTDSGVTWTPTGNSNLNTKNWRSVASSSDGSKLFAGVYNGDIYRSTDSGVTWTPTGNSNLNTKNWSGIACSSDGSKLIAYATGMMGPGGDIYTSTDSGVTWTPSGNSNFINNIGWSAVVSSSDGSKFAAASGGYDVGYLGIYTYNSAAVCFLEGTNILSLVDGQETYVPVESIRKGVLVKTHLHGYKPVDIIATSKIFNSGDNNRIKDRLYKYSEETNSDLFEDLIVTGGHSSLVDELSESQKEATSEFWEVLQKTDDKYRLLACVDENTIPYEEEGTFNIYHIALEHEEETANYGIYANGLLVESCSKLHLMNEITMKSIE